MREFFHGWRRKAGCGLLLVSLVFMAAWMRSLVVSDHIEALGVFAVSNKGGFVIGPRDSDATFWNSLPISENPEVDLPIPFFIITIPLASLSAYLILWKPRKPSPNTITPDGA